MEVSVFLAMFPDSMKASHSLILNIPIDDYIHVQSSSLPSRVKLLNLMPRMQEVAIADTCIV